MASITIDINDNNIVAEAKKKAFETLKVLDVDSLNKLAELSKNPKALKYLKNPPLAVKVALGI